MQAEELREEVTRLGPWHIDVDITPEISTAPPPRPPGVYRPRESFLARLNRIYPSGLEGRSVLDCACNCGAYLFFARELGAGRCLGFDVRDHWIRQARFLARRRQKPTDDMRFEVCNLYDLPEINPGTFDISFFLGVFYHLHDPVSGLKVAADRTRELLVLHTKGMPGAPDGALVASEESPEGLLAGAQTLCWLPTGPSVLTQILNWLGFPEVRCSIWLPSRGELDRIEVLAARTPNFFDSWDAARPEGIKGLLEVIETHTHPREEVLVMGEDERLLRRLRRNASRFPANDGHDNEGLEEIERCIASGARFLVVPADEIAQLEERPRMMTRLIESWRLLVDDPLCRIYAISQSNEKRSAPRMSPERP